MGEWDPQKGRDLMLDQQKCPLQRMGAEIEFRENPFDDKKEVTCEFPYCQAQNFRLRLLKME